MTKGPGNSRLVLTLAASLLFSLSLIYFSGFDLVNPVPVSWPAVHATGKSGPQGYRRLLRQYPSILTPARLRRLLGLEGRYRLTHEGRGDTIALVEEPSRLDMTGIDAFDHRFGLPPPVISTEYSRSAGQASAEETLDIEWVHAVAPEARIAVITLPDTGWPGMPPSLPWLTVARDLARLKPDVASTSVIYNGWEATAALRQFSLAGADSLFSGPLFAAAGDSGPAATFPGMLPGVIAVGGVSLPGSGGLHAPRPWPGTAGGWDWLSFPKPSYQEGVGRSTWRTTPDVAFVAGFPGYAINIGGVWTAATGASFAAPILAALWAAQMPANLTGDQAVALLYRYRGVPGVFTNPGPGAWSRSAGLGVPDFRRLAALAQVPVAAWPPTRYRGALYVFLTMVLSVLVIMAAGLSGGAKGAKALVCGAIIVAGWFSVGPFSSLFTSADPLSRVLHYPWAAVLVSVLYAGALTAAPVLVSFSGLPVRLNDWLHRGSRDREQ
ncbi:MAG: hypothetical protein M0Z41_20765 [Peptococcaceae bacterium]|jgi:hypothetical protein|nr:hypothetical protein [Peptococcaceae bacterium]